MQRTRQGLSPLLAVDILLLNASLLAGVQLKHSLDPGVVWNDSYFILLLVFNLGWLVASRWVALYTQTKLDTDNAAFFRLAQVLLLHLLLITAFIALRKGYYYSRLALGFSYVFLGVALVLWRGSYRRWLRLYFRRIRQPRRTVVAVGFGAPTQQLATFFSSQPELGYVFAGFFSNQAGLRPEDEKDRLGTLADLTAYLLAHRVDELYAYLPDLTEADTQQLLAFADRFLIPLKVVPDFKAFTAKSLRLQLYGDLPVFYLRPHPLEDHLNQGIKRAFDIVFASVFLLAVASWLFPILALLVKLSSRGPVLFAQLRAGKSGKPFTCYKFRSMRLHIPEFKQATVGDARITPIGSFLRRTSLDELPQFINVLLGDMSIVGPRPHPLQLDSQYAPLLEQYNVRHVVKPGLTGLAQTRGYRGETPDVRTMQHRVRMDLFYVANWSLQLDIQIILSTILLVVRGDERAY